MNDAYGGGREVLYMKVHVDINFLYIQSVLIFTNYTFIHSGNFV